MNFRSPQPKDDSDEDINNGEFDSDFDKEQAELKKKEVEKKKAGTVEIKGFSEPSTDRVRKIIQEDIKFKI